MKWRYPLRARCLSLYYGAFFTCTGASPRGLTLGVRGLVIDAQGRVFLVKHGYVSGWHLPGGGVEPGETMRQAFERELREEGNIDLTDKPLFHGLYFNGHVSDRDHVASIRGAGVSPERAATARP